MLETPVVGALSLSGGARAEVYKQQMAPNSPFRDSGQMTMADADTSITKADRTDVNVLPAAALKYDLGSGMLLRAAYGMTVGRPQARELAPFMYYDFLRDRNIVGNIELRTTLIHSADFRWEWFFGTGQVLAASLFYKNFRRPIEQQVISTDGTSKFSNTPSAQTYGAEFELRSSLEQLHKSLRLFDFGANLTLLRSEVEIPEELSGAVAAGTRRMFGQAPYVINLTLRFAEPVTKFSASLVYNVVGPRIIDVGLRAGTNILPNVEEQPFHALDLITSWQATEHLKLKLKWRNMMFQSRRIQQGSVTTLRTYPGTFVSVGLDYSY
jgi:outer membrane receptor protein involved in Fe transport